MGQAENNRANREGYKTGKAGKDPSIGQRILDMGSAERSAVRQGRFDRRADSVEERKTKASHLGIVYPPSVDELVATLWDQDGNVRLGPIELLAASVEPEYRDWFIADMCSLIEHKRNQAIAHHQIAQMIIHEACPDTSPAHVAEAEPLHAETRERDTLILGASHLDTVRSLLSFAGETPAVASKDSHPLPSATPRVGRADFETALERLPSHSQHTLLAFLQKGLTAAEVAAQLNCSEHTAQEQFEHALKLMRTLLATTRVSAT